MSNRTRAKMHLHAVVSNQWGGVKAFFHTEYDPGTPEDMLFQKATPTGLAEFCIDNPDAISRLVIGKSYYFDITPVD